MFARLGLKAFERAHLRIMLEWLMPLAMQTTQGIVLAKAVMDELRARRIVLPAIRVLELLCAEAATRAQREVYRLLTVPLVDNHRAALDRLLTTTPGKSMSLLTWIRQPPGEPSGRSLLTHIDRLKVVRAPEKWRTSCVCRAYRRFKD